MASGTRDPQLLEEVVAMLVLALLTERESYGFELVARLQVDGLGDIAPGTMPARCSLSHGGRVPGDRPARESSSA